VGICFHYLSVPPRILKRCQEDSELDPYTILLDKCGEERELPSGWQHIDVDKAWDGIAYLLSAERRATDDLFFPSDLLGQAVDGAEILNEERLDQGRSCPRYLPPRKVKEVVAALKGIGPALFRKHFDPNAMEAADVYPSGWHEDRLDYLLGYFKELKNFYKNAAARGHAVIVWGG
jgi:hypothetical protein